MFKNQQKNLPKEMRRTLPERPSTLDDVKIKGMTSNAMDEYNEEAFKQYNEKALVPCENCGRTFLPDRLMVHARSCRSQEEVPRTAIKPQRPMTSLTPQQPTDLLTPQKVSKKKISKVKSNSKIRSSVQNKFLDYLKKHGVEIKEPGEMPEPSEVQARTEPNDSTGDYQSMSKPTGFRPFYD